MVDGKLYRHPPATDLIAKRKDLTRRFLEAKGVPVPIGADFALDEVNAAKLYFQGLGKTAVTKPSNLGGSRGVTVGIESDDEFVQGWLKASKTSGANRILVEEHIRGIELRLFVVGNLVAAAAARIQPIVVGDGKSTVTELIDIENGFRSRNFRHRKHPIKPDKMFLRSQGYYMSTRLPRNQVAFLNPLTVLRAGAINVEISNLLSAEVKSIAIQAKNAIPNLEIAGIDVLMENIRDVRTARVLEVNTAPAIDLHRFPSIGQPVELPEIMVRYFSQN